MWWALAITMLAVLGLAGRARAESGGGHVSDPDYPLSVWGPVVAGLIRSEFPRVDYDVAMAWLDMESGGNPCEFGRPDQFGKDGNPREIGLGQMYNSEDGTADDFTGTPVTPAQFRAYCVPGAQRRNRKLTQQEMIDQVRWTLLRKIDLGIDAAQKAVQQYGLQDWPTKDFWKLVKAPHALPGIIGLGLPAVVKKLGRAPRDWAEFRQVLGMDSYHRDMAGHVAYNHPTWHSALDACQKCGDAYRGGVA